MVFISTLYEVNDDCLVSCHLPVLIVGLSSSIHHGYLSNKTVISKDCTDFIHHCNMILELLVEILFGLILSLSHPVKSFLDITQSIRKLLAVFEGIGELFDDL